MNQWDGQHSGIRERLALLAAIGPTVEPDAWGYNPSRDRWYYCGSGSTRHGGTIEVTQEGVASLKLIESKWGWGYQTAMAFIGYPESTGTK